MNLHSKSILWSAVFCAAVLASGCSRPKAGHVQDEALQAGRSAESFRHAAEDYFHDMDRGVALTKEEIQGRNMWIVWTGGNDRFWDAMTNYTFGAFDQRWRREFGQLSKWKSWGLSQP